MEKLYVSHLSGTRTDILHQLGTKERSGAVMGQKEEKQKGVDERRDVRSQCLVLQPQVNVCRVHVYMRENKRGMHAIGLCRGVSASECACVRAQARVCLLALPASQ